MPAWGDRAQLGASKSTRVVVEFFTDEEEGFNGVVGFVDSGPEADKQAARFGQIVSIETDKNMSGAGTFSMVVKRPPVWERRDGATVGSWQRLWRDPEDTWVRITFYVNGFPIETMVGTVDSINENTAINKQGARTETYTITGRDFGKAFETTPLFFLFYTNGESEEQAYANYIESLAAIFVEDAPKTPADIVRGLLNLFTTEIGGAYERAWMLPASLQQNGLSLWDWLQQRIQPQTKEEDGFTIAIQPLLPDESRVLWSTMQEFCNPILNELWFDLGPDAGAVDAFRNQRPTLYMRRRPFPTRFGRRAWDALPRHFVKRKDLISRQVAKGGASTRFNYWLVNIEGSGASSFEISKIMREAGFGGGNGAPGTMPIYNLNSIARHGIRKFEQTTKYIPYFQIAEDSDANQNGMLRTWAKWTNLVHDWYSTNPMELSGRLELSTLWPEIRVGETLEEETADGAVTYYVEGVSHRWQFPEGGHTTVTVTRGTYTDENLLAYVYAGEGASASTPTIQRSQSRLPGPTEVVESYPQNRRPSQQEQCFIEEDVSDSDAIRLLAAGCRFRAEDKSIPIVDTDDEAATVNAPAGEVLADPDGEMSAAQTKLGESEPLPEYAEDTQTNEDFNPPSGEDRSREFGQRELERGEPIEFDFDDSDPIGGIDVEDTLPSSEEGT